MLLEKSEETAKAEEKKKKRSEYEALALGFFMVSLEVWSLLEFMSVARVIALSLAVVAGGIGAGINWGDGKADFKKNKEKDERKSKMSAKTKKLEERISAVSESIDSIIEASLTLVNVYHPVLPGAQRVAEVRKSAMEKERKDTQIWRAIQEAKTPEEKKALEKILNEPSRDDFLTEIEAVKKEKQQTVEEGKIPKKPSYLTQDDALSIGKKMIEAFVKGGLLIYAPVALLTNAWLDYDYARALNIVGFILVGSIGSAYNANKKYAELKKARDAENLEKDSEDVLEKAEGKFDKLTKSLGAITNIMDRLQGKIKPGPRIMIVSDSKLEPAAARTLAPASGASTELRFSSSAPPAAVAPFGSSSSSTSVVLKAAQSAPAASAKKLLKNKTLVTQHNPDLPKSSPKKPSKKSPPKRPTFAGSQKKGNSVLPFSDITSETSLKR